MFSDLLSADVQSFIRKHEHDDTSQLILKLDMVNGVPLPIIAEQIIGRRKAKDKLPTFYQTNTIVYPPGISLEQSSSEQTAVFKSIYAFDTTDHKGLLVDLTGGFGIDSFFLNQKFDEVFYVEPKTHLLNIAKHNHEQLGAKHISHYNLTAENFLMSCSRPLGCIYIDPSRRAEGNRKVFSFSDCEPDVTRLLTLIFEKTNHLLIKASPLLDIQLAINELKFVKHVFVISVQNECKELLFRCERDFTEEPTIEAINISRDHAISSLVFHRSMEQATTAVFSEPLGYLYEPNASILKAGAFKTMSVRFNLAKLHPNTHLYTSVDLKRNFPGNIFRIIAHTKPAPKTVKEFFPTGRANLSTRNYPLSAKALKAKTGLKDGGDRFLIGFSGMLKTHLIVAEKLI